MVEPEKPFACTMPDCGMTFTNEDHLQLHTKKHDMMLQLGLEQKAAFVADQTPTPTRFIRNCEEVGLFQDLQNDNPFDEGFKRAMETKQHILSLESIATISNTDDLHTPQMVFPLEHTDSTLFSTTNNQRNITISRSSSDESGAIKEFETTTISKLTNEVTTISRIVEKHDDNRVDDSKLKDEVIKDSISYSNNIIKIHSEIRRDDMNKNPIQAFEDTTKNNKITDVPPIMSQTSIDYVVETLTNDLCNDTANKHDESDNIEVLIRLPNGRQVRMKSVEDEPKVNAKEKLKRVLSEKSKTKSPTISNLVPISGGTLIPVTIVAAQPQKIPIPPFRVARNYDKKAVKRKNLDTGNQCHSASSEKQSDLDSRSAASRRYRARLKESWIKQCEENKQLRASNDRLLSELTKLKLLLTEHLKRCPNADDISTIQEKL